MNRSWRIKPSRWCISSRRRKRLARPSSTMNCKNKNDIVTLIIVLISKKIWCYIYLSVFLFNSIAFISIHPVHFANSCFHFVSICFVSGWPSSTMNCKNENGMIWRLVATNNRAYDVIPFISVLLHFNCVYFRSSCLIYKFLFWLRFDLFCLRMTNNPADSMVAAVVRVMCKTDYGETAR